MAISSIEIYTRACPVDSDKDWYHGELTRVQAERALRESQDSNCFLIRESRVKAKRSLTLSLIHHGEVYHTTIEYGPGRYRLQGEPPEKAFSKLNDLVSHYRDKALHIDPKTTLGVACEKTENAIELGEQVTEPHTNGTYARGKPAHLAMFHWYHDKMTKEEAEEALGSVQDANVFLVRQSDTDLILSMKVKGYISHVTVNYSPKGYSLEGKKHVFTTIPEMITYYQIFPVESDQKQVLGTVCKRQTSGSIDEVSLTFSASYLYEKLVSDIDWYHGELSEIEAEKALRDCQDSNCFLIRESEVSLILSLIHHEEVYHTTIEHEPGQYRLEGESPEKTFSKLDYLVSHYRSKALHIEPKTILGVACEKTEHATESGAQDTETTTAAYAEILPKEFNATYAEILPRYTDPAYSEAKNSAVTVTATQDRMSSDTQHQQSVSLAIPTTDSKWVPGTECVAKYNFKGLEANDLPFEKGDILVIIGASKDPNWFKARRFDGLEGMVPYNYIDILKEGVTVPRLAVQIQKMSWFHGNISRSEAEEMLKPYKNGKYLVRESQNYKGDYTLCVSHENKVEHYRVRRTSSGEMTVDDELYFENLLKLVEHYQNDADGLCTRLKFSVNKTKDVSVVVNKDDFKETGWAIKKEDIIKESRIGKGKFGEVWLGEYDGKKVAIKIQDLKYKSTNHFIVEAAIMTTLRHPNLVHMIGISLDTNPIYLVTEYVAKGSLVDYLRSRGRAVISKQIQLDFAKDVCKGMIYLESRNFVHRDLAAHNVLISEGNIAKISDFGLTKEILSKSEATKLPVKWTAPEALRDNIFSSKSDVWSFGILLWEIYSYGRVPYPHVQVEDVAQHVERGYRMDLPDGCPDSMYQIMKKCWNKDPSQRPYFTSIKKLFDLIMNATS